VSVSSLVQAAQPELGASGAGSLVVLAADAVAPWIAAQPARVATWLAATGFVAEPGKLALVPDESGAIAQAVAVAGAVNDPLALADLPTRLPEGSLWQTEGLEAAAAGNLALGWALGAYRFDRFRSKAGSAPARLVWPAAADGKAVEAVIAAITLVRDLVNRPANDLGPAELADAAIAVAEAFGAKHSVLVGEALLENNYPAIYAVGYGSDRAPRLVDFSWGDEAAPRVTLVGKGVVFDTGGYDLKPSSNMLLMKKDMGGAAHALGLAHMIMAAGLPVRLRVLLPIVENMVSGRAFRPMDVVRTRKGLSIEIGNTDAEGRVILADALAEAAAEKPALLFDFATLTGAARVALGTDLPALFCNDDALAEALVAAGTAVCDPMWRLPLHKGYEKLIRGKVADITNSPASGFGGAITAALFLQRFVEADIPWAHFDLFAWNAANGVGRPEGGEAFALRAIFEVIAARFGHIR
jgi:leucyl aminopeptidase